MSTTKIPSIGELLASSHFAPGLPADIDIQGWNSDHPVFDRLVAETSPSTIIEVGTWKGRSARHLATAAEAARVFCIDTWLGGIDHVLSDKPVDDLKRDAFGSPRLFHQFLANFTGEPCKDRIHPIQQTSINGARVLAHHGITAQLIYIDGSHEYADVYADLCAYVHLLAPGGIIFGDDFRSFPGVFAAVLRFSHEYRFKVEEVARNYWILRAE